jgi:hypothetical protein
MRRLGLRTPSLAVFGASMGEIIRFIPKSERERARLIREARAIYDRIFPPAGPVSEKQNKRPTVGGANTRRGEGALLP